MRTWLWSVGMALLLTALAASVALAAAPAGRAEPIHGCAHFGTQAAAQAYFIELGGSLGHRVGSLDPDRDGIACEQLGGAYAGYANLGYNRTKNFFYGFGAMPESGPEADPFPCLIGNRHFSDGPRRVNVYRVMPGPDKRIFSRNGVGAEARLDSGRLVWKGGREVVLPGRYYAEFEERIPLHPYGSNECPAFRSPLVRLP